MRFAIEFGELKIHWGVRVGSRDLELQVELVPHEFMNEPALASPLGSIFVAFHVEPVVVVFFAELDVLDQHHVLFFQALDPLLTVLRSRYGLYKGQTLQTR